MGNFYYQYHPSLYCHSHKVWPYCDQKVMIDVEYVKFDVI
jgi:hypothetical protein